MKKLFCSLVLSSIMILSTNAATKTTAPYVAPHCDYTITYHTSDGRTIVASGHVEGMWCIEFLRDFYN